LKSQYKKYIVQYLGVTDCKFFVIVFNYSSTFPVSFRLYDHLGSKATYHVEQAGLVVVDEFFTYKQRPTDNSRVIDYFMKRQQGWKDEEYVGGARDKWNNPLVAIPGGQDRARVHSWQTSQLLMNSNSIVP